MSLRGRAEHVRRQGRPEPEVWSESRRLGGAETAWRFLCRCQLSEFRPRPNPSKSASFAMEPTLWKGRDADSLFGRARSVRAGSLPRRRFAHDPLHVDSEGDVELRAVPQADPEEEDARTRVRWNRHLGSFARSNRRPGPGVSVELVEGTDGERRPGWN